MAGEGGAHHPRSGREDALFRGRAARIRRRPDGLLPVFVGARSDREAQDRRAVPSYSTSTVYGVGVTVPYYWALAPELRCHLHAHDHDPAGPLLQGEWRHRLVNGAYSIRASGIFQLDKDVFLQNGRDAGLSRLARQPGDLRASSISPTGGCGAGTRPCYRTRTISRITVSCENLQSEQSDQVRHPGLRPLAALPRGSRRPQLLRRPRDVLLRFLPWTIRSQIPIVHPVIDHDYVLKQPDLRRRTRLPQQPDQLVPGHRQFRPDLAGRPDQRLVHADDRRPRGQELDQLPAARRSRQVHPRSPPSGLGSARSSTHRARCSRPSSSCAGTLPT